MKFALFNGKCRRKCEPELDPGVECGRIEFDENEKAMFLLCEIISRIVLRMNTQLNNQCQRMLFLPAKPIRIGQDVTSPSRESETR